MKESRLSTARRMNTKCLFAPNWTSDDTSPEHDLADAEPKGGVAECVPRAAGAPTIGNSLTYFRRLTFHIRLVGNTLVRRLNPRGRERRTWSWMGSAQNAPHVTLITQIFTVHEFTRIVLQSILKHIPMVPLEFCQKKVNRSSAMASWVTYSA